MYRPRMIPPRFRNDKFHTERMMCPTCGLIFDFEPEFGPDELGWPSYDPPFDHVNYWIDDKGEIHEEEQEHKACCPRCNTYFDDDPLLPISVFRSTDIKDLMHLIEKGEGLTIEFMSNYPDDAHELGKEIAAFATTQGGRIFLGVDNAGNIIGLKGIESPEGKDNLQQRVRGLLGKVSPKPEVYTNFYADADKNIHIAVITVLKGNRPLYSVNGRYYIRDMEESRQATTEEVVRLVEKWMQQKAG